MSAGYAKHASAKEPDAPPAGDGGAGGKESSNSRVSGTDLAAVYKYFNDQRGFVRALTDLAEDLRFLEAAERQRQLQPGLDGIQVPPCAFFPLGHSSDPMYKVAIIC